MLFLNLLFRRQLSIDFFADSGVWNDAFSVLSRLFQF